MKMLQLCRDALRCMLFGSKARQAAQAPRAPGCLGRVLCVSKLPGGLGRVKTQRLTTAPMGDPLPMGLPGMTTVGTVPCPFRMHRWPQQRVQELQKHLTP